MSINFLDTQEISYNFLSLYVCSSLEFKNLWIGLRFVCISIGRIGILMSCCSNCVDLERFGGNNEENYKNREHDRSKIRD